MRNGKVLVLLICLLGWLTHVEAALPFTRADANAFHALGTRILADERSASPVNLLRRFLLTAVPARALQVHARRLPHIFAQIQQFEEGDMKDINRVGVSEKRKTEVRELMEKLRLKKRGALQPLREDQEAQELSIINEGPPEQPNTTAIQQSQQQPVKAQVEVVENISSSYTTQQTTSGIGGTWSQDKNAETKTYEPSKSGSWGLFERPKDISKAFGGGRKIGIGGYQEDPETKRKKKEETDRLLRQYRASRAGLSSDTKLEEEHREEIIAALNVGKREMRSGFHQSAIRALEKVVGFLNSETELSGDVLSELGFAWIAAGEPEKAKEVHTKLYQHKMNKYKRIAVMCEEFEKAEKFMRYNNTGPSEMSKLLVSSSDENWWQSAFSRKR